MKIVLQILFCLLALTGFTQSDTLNQTDSLGKKYGHWIIYGKDKPNSGYSLNDKVEEGKYLNHKKTGLWRSYYPGNKIKYIAEFINNRPHGNYEIFYENGNLEERGKYLRTIYCDSFLRYHENGIISQRKYFNNLGKLDGWVTYYFETGEIQLKYFAKDGVEVMDSLIYRGEKTKTQSKSNNKSIYDILCLCNLNERVWQKMEINEKGDSLFYFDTAHYSVLIKSKSRNDIFNQSECWISNLNMQIKSSQGFSISKGILSKLPEIPEKTPCDGYSKIYNLNKFLIYDGEFKNCKLFNGKKYIYDKDGLLMKIEVYKQGKYFGDAQIENIPIKD